MIKYGTAFINELQERLEQATDSVSDPVLREATKYALLPAGKCLRPYLFVSWYHFANPTDEIPWDVAVAIEMIHTASLIHDDIIDNEQIRRGRPSLVQRSGLRMAILVGDVLIFRAMSLLSQQRSLVAYFLYNDMERRLKENHSNLSPEDALEVLGRCQLNSIGVKGTNQRVLKITEFDNEQRQLMQGLECEYAGEPKWYKKVLKKAENLV